MKHCLPWRKRLSILRAEFSICFSSAALSTGGVCLAPAPPVAALRAKQHAQHRFKGYRDGTALGSPLGVLRELSACVYTSVSWLTALTQGHFILAYIVMQVAAYATLNGRGTAQAQE